MSNKDVATLLGGLFRILVAKREGGKKTVTCGKFVFDGWQVVFFSATFLFDHSGSSKSEER